MIRTTYTDTKGLLDILETCGHVTAAEEEVLISRAAAAVVFGDLGITIADTREECDQVLAQIPKQLFVRTIELRGGGWALLHGRLKPS
jgi:hypothetical protein